uniref:Uncharacterized protein n=1 Tax=Nyssomyia neivai TaxID=330878 RepID=A0A1L8DBH4_9DIPT
MKSAPFSAIIIVGEYVLPLVILGITLESITLKPVTPLTLSLESSTAFGSESGPIFVVPTGWKAVVVMYFI